MNALKTASVKERVRNFALKAIGDGGNVTLPDEEVKVNKPKPSKASRAAFNKQKERARAHTATTSDTKVIDKIPKEEVIKSSLWNKTKDFAKNKPKTTAGIVGGVALGAGVLGGLALARAKSKKENREQEQ